MLDFFFKTKVFTSKNKNIQWYNLLQIMHGLHYLHTLDKPLVHGNLKPSNILIDGNGIPRLADFGLQDVCK